MNTVIFPASSQKPFIVHCNINNNVVPFEVDSGAAVSVITESVATQLQAILTPTVRRVAGYDGSIIPLAGEVDLCIECNAVRAMHRFIVAKGTKYNLLGRDLFSKLNIQIVFNANAVSHVPSSVLDEFSHYFSDSYQSTVTEQVQIDVDKDADPIFCKPRQIPIRLKDAVKTEIQRLVDCGTLTKVYSAAWASPIVTVYKKDGCLRLCADFSTTVNKYLKPVNAPLVTIDEAIAAVGHAKIFSKLDLASAFLQLPVHPDSKKFLVVNTAEGFFQFNYLPFGLTCSPGIFQAFISKIIANVPGVLAYQDDIIIMSPNPESHSATLRTVLLKLQDAGLKLNVKKCHFFVDHVEYLGFLFDKAGIRPNSSKIDAIVHAPIPCDVKQLQSFIGMCNFYSRFIHNSASLMAPLYSLLKKDVPFLCTKLQQEAFDQVKQQFANGNILQHFVPHYETCLEVDSSSYGLGAVLMQRALPSEPWLPVQFASRSLNSAEKNYSQLEKEALSVIFGIDKFCKFLLGAKFKIFNDHKPLHSLFSKFKAIPNSCSARVLRWALKLSQYDYEFVFSRGVDNVQSDCLSRLPLPHFPAESEPYELVFLVNSVHKELISYETVKQHSNLDPSFQLLQRYIKHGCPQKIVDPVLSPIKCSISRMTLFKGCILFQDRVFIPPSLRSTILAKFHENHPGIVAMKCLARELIWYPGLDKDIEQVVRNCQICQSVRPKPPQNSHVSWPLPKQAVGTNSR